jgi:Ca-activated chloride channel family protein
MPERSAKASESRKDRDSSKEKKQPPAAESAADEAQASQPIAREESAGDDRYHDWGAKIYLSNDDTMSLSSAQRVIWAIDHFEPIPPEHIRPHELLNYFSFETLPLGDGDDFSVSAGIQAKPGESAIHSLGLAIAGRSVDKEQRRNAALTFVIDRSGSMHAEGRMEYLKRGLLRMLSELKTGDMVNLVYFDDTLCVPLENFVVGRDAMPVLEGAIQRLRPLGSTDLHLGLKRGYELADRGYQDQFSNRVVLITDAMANTGVTDQEMIALISNHYDKRRIRLSGVGVGRDFNDALLDRLTERGKGAYVFLGSEAEVDAIFGTRFPSLIETVANDVHFRLHLPPSLRMNVFYGEESSVNKEEVQAIHYFAGTRQLFLSDLMARGGKLRPQDGVMLTIEYEHPDTGTKMEEEFAFTLGEIAAHTRNVQKGRLIMSFVDGLKDLVMSSPTRMEHRIGGWVDEVAFEQCERGRQSLNQQSRGLEDDREVARVLGLWEKFCSRYEPARNPVRREPPRGPQVWPSAQ